MKEKKYYAEILDHQYLPQYVIMVDIGNRFRNVQGVKLYWFPLFLSCVKKKNSGQETVQIWMEEENIMQRSSTIATYLNM